MAGDRGEEGGTTASEGQREDDGGRGLNRG